MRQQYDPTLPIPPALKTRQVTIQEFTAGSDDAYGQASGSWGNLSTNPTVWGMVRKIGSNTAEYAHQNYDAATSRVVIDWRDDITPGPTTDRYRLVIDSRTYYVGHVSNIGDANVQLEFLVSEFER